MALQWLVNLSSYNRLYGPQKYLLSGPLQMKFANPFPALSHIHCHQLIMGVGKRAASIREDQRGKSILRENQSSVEARGCRNCWKGIYHWVEVQREGELGWVCGVVRQRWLGRGGTEQWEDQSTKHSRCEEGAPQRCMGRLAKAQDEGQVELSASRFPMEYKCSCFETAASWKVGCVLVVEIGRLFLRFPNCEGEKAFSSLRRNCNLDVYRDEIISLHLYLEMQLAT